MMDIDDVYFDEYDDFLPSEQLIYACSNDDVDLIKIILDDGDETKIYIFLTACEHGACQIAKYLLSSRDLDPSIKNVQCLTRAALNGYDNLVDLLLNDSRIDLASNHSSAIKSSYEFGFYGITRKLILHPKSDPYQGMKIAMKLSDQELINYEVVNASEHIIPQAVKMNRKDMIEIFIESGMATEVLISAISQNKRDIVAMSLSKPINLNMVPIELVENTSSSIQELILSKLSFDRLSDRLKSVLNALHLHQLESQIFSDSVILLTINVNMHHPIMVNKLTLSITDQPFLWYQKLKRIGISHEETSKLTKSEFMTMMALSFTVDDIYAILDCRDHWCDFNKLLELAIKNRLWFILPRIFRDERCILDTVFISRKLPDFSYKIDMKGKHVSNHPESMVNFICFLINLGPNLGPNLEAPKELTDVINILYDEYSHLILGHEIILRALFLHFVNNGETIEIIEKVLRRCSGIKLSPKEILAFFASKPGALLKLLDKYNHFDTNVQCIYDVAKFSMKQDVVYFIKKRCLERNIQLYEKPSNDISKEIFFNQR